jgi:glycosyltransferase involved in cell wall biosynthesis
VNVKQQFHHIPLLIASLPIRQIEGGVSTMVQTLAEILQVEGYDVKHICNTLSARDPKNRTIWKLLKGNWKVGTENFQFGGRLAVEIGRRFPIIEPLHYLGNAREWNQISHRFPIINIVSGSNHPGFAFALANRKFVCWVATPYDEDKEDRRRGWALPRRVVDKYFITPVTRSIEGYIYRKCSQIITLSSYTADIISIRFKIPRNQIIVLPCPIDTEKLHPPSKVPPDKIVLFVGRYNDPRKNIAMLIRAFARVVKQVQDAGLLLVGDEPTSDLFNLAARFGLNHSVQFRGVIPHGEVITYYHRAAVFAIPSWQEGLGIVGLEAMACGLPIVSTRCGGPEDFVRNGATGFLVPLNDDEAMANHLVEMLTNPLLRIQMGVQARRDTEEHFSYKALADIFDNIYHRVYPELFKSDLNEAEPFREVYGGP